MLADGEFGRQLVLSLCYLGREIREPGELAGEIREHIHNGASPPLILCPTSLNRYRKGRGSSIAFATCIGLYFVVDLMIKTLFVADFLNLNGF